jgi:multimeric flavodoxin WrbA
MSNVKKKILLINGSPRKNGLTNALLMEFKNKIAELNKTNDKVTIDLIHLSDFKIEHCTGCDTCLRAPNTCPFSEKDDMLKIENALKSSDVIIVGSPAYFANVTALVKDIIDRSRPMKMQKYQLKDKIFSAVVAAGLKDGGSNFVFDCLFHWALIQGMIVVGSLGHPVLMNNLPSESLQMQGAKEFRKPTEPGDLAKTLVGNLAERIFNLLK